MKLRSSVKTGSVTLTEARRAARDAKAAREGKSLADVSPAVREGLVKRYLGHFGPTAKKSVVRSGAAKKRRPTAKKSGARKASRKAKGRSGS